MSLSYTVGSIENEDIERGIESGHLALETNIEGWGLRKQNILRIWLLLLEN
jgi:hypothetical protein